MGAETSVGYDQDDDGEPDRDARRALRRERNGQDSHAPGLLLPTLFARQVARSPESPAVICENLELTYRQLSDAADRLAARLTAAGAGPERLVGVSLQRSPDLVVALLAVLKTGAAYLPLDPELPLQRINVMLADADPACMVTSNALYERWTGQAWRRSDIPLAEQASGCGARHPVVEVYSRHRATEPSAAPPHPLNPAYSIYTSGSSGTPKGVLVPHAAIVNRLLWMQRYFGIGPDDRILQKTPFHFDVSVWEFFWPLITGAALVVARPDGHRDPRYLAEVIADQQVTTVHFVPSMLALFLDEPTARQCTSLRRVVCSGEALSPRLQARFMAALDVPLYNLYGPTEAAVDVTFWKCEDDRPDSVPIGHAIDNIRTYVLDADLAPVRTGETGELYLAGVGLARGYLRRPGLTADRFLPDPFGPQSARMYRTGDLARCRADGALEYLGRSDDQVKICGVRIELGEIEAALSGFPGVSGAAVAVHHDQLIGFIVTDRDGAPDGTSPWREIFDARYAERSSDPGFDMRGWVSSIHGEELSAADMRQWRDLTVAQLRELRPKRILEIGCGSGMLASELIADCTEYVGIDVAENELRILQRRLDGLAPGKARLLPLEAIQVAQVAGEFDVVVLNSVLQYFPHVTYLVDTLTQATAKCAPDGALFIGDVRHRSLARLLYAEQAAALQPGIQRPEIKRAIEASAHAEHELLVDPGFFLGMARSMGIDPSNVEVRPKPGSYDNELSRYRYDVLIRLGAPLAGPPPGQLYDWLAAGSVTQLLDAGPPALVLRGIPNARLSRVAGLLSAEPLDEDHAAARLYPGELTEIAAALGYGIRLDWGDGTPDGSFNAAIYRDGPAPRVPRNEPAEFNPDSFTNRPSTAHAQPPSPGIWSFLCDSLPAALVPARIVAIDALPLTPSGKLDRKALAALEGPRAVSHGTPPRSRSEAALCELFVQVLSVHSIGIDDSFFELGGDSILAIQVAGRARNVGLSLTLGDIFRHRTPRALATICKETGPASHARTADDLGALLLTPITHWRADRGEPVAGDCQWVLVRTPPGLIAAQLGTLLQALIDGHDALRTKLTVGEPAGGEPPWRMEILPRHAIRAGELITRVAAPGSAAVMTSGQLAAHAAAAASRLRPNRAENMQAVWFDAGRDYPGRLLWVINHLVVDGVSWRILLEDIAGGWRQLRDSGTVDSPCYVTSYRQWARDLLEHAPAREPELRTWRTVLETPDPPLGTGSLDPTQDLTSTVESAEFELECDVTQALLAPVPTRFGVEINDVLIAALAAAIGAHRRTGSAVLLRMEGHGREDILDGVDVSRTVGWFTSIFPASVGPVQTYAGDDRDAWVERALRCVSRQLRDLPDRGVGYGILRYLSDGTRDQLAAFGTPQISFNYLGRFSVASSDDWDLAPECRALHSQTPKELPAACVLEIQAMVEDGPDGPRFSAELSWPSRLLTRADAAAIGTTWFRTLRVFAQCGDRAVTELRPADFPLVALSEMDLDLLVAEIDGVTEGAKV
jgi:amino acid adenylation domain-containing protein/non-ribosomal peptide synthase protein (TIGR01720 family)